MPARDAPALAAMVSLSAQYPRFGYRRIQVFLDRQGHTMSADRVWRLWRQAKLQVPRKRSRRRVAPGRPRPVAPTGANQVEISSSMTGRLHRSAGVRVVQCGRSGRWQSGFRRLPSVASARGLNAERSRSTMLAANEAAVRELAYVTLKKIAVELTRSLRSRWAKREAERAKLRVMVKTLRRQAETL